MRNYLLIFFLLALFNYTSGQISFSPDPIEVTANVATENIRTDFELTNEGADTVRIAWTLQNIEQPTDWQYYVCDTEICYNFNQNESSQERPNIIAPGESIIVMFHTLPDGVEGSGSYSINFFDVDLPDSINVDVPISLNTITSSTSNLETKGLKIFPNPTSDYFKINTGDLISQIDVVTVVGKKVKTFRGHQGGLYDVSGLSRGIYYVRLLDNAGESIKVIRLKKD